MTLQLLLLNLISFLSTQLFSLSRSHWMAAQLPGVSAIPPKLAEGGLCPFIQVTGSPMKTTRPSINPWGTPLVTGLHLDSVPLITTLWALPLRQFLTHLNIHSSIPRFLSFITKDVVRYTVKSLAEVNVHSIHCSLLIYPASDAIIEGYQVGRSWLPLGESLLTTPDNLHLFQLLGDSLQNKLFHHLPGDRGEAEWPVVFQLLPLAISEGWSNIGVPPVLRHLFYSPRPFNDDREDQQSPLSAPSAHVDASHQGPWVCSHWFWLDGLCCSSEGRSSTPQTPSLTSRFTDSPRGRLCSKDWSKEGGSVPPPSQCLLLPGHIFSSFTVDILKETFLVILYFLCQVKFQVGLSLLCCIPTVPDNIPIFFASRQALFPHFVDLLSIYRHILLLKHSTVKNWMDTPTFRSAKSTLDACPTSSFLDLS